MANNGPRSLEEIENSEHIDPLTTGDNISAKKMAIYGWYPTGTDWVRVQVDANGVMQTSGSGGGGGGTQYVELSTTSPATGTLALGRYQSSLPTLTNGQMNEPMLDSSSRLLVGQLGVSAALADSTANPTIGGVQSYLMAYNGTTWDRLHEFFLTSDNSSVQTGLYTLDQNLLYNGSNWDRARSLAGVSGTTGVQAVGLTDGTNTANILKSDGTSAGQNAQLVANQMPASSTATWTTATSLNTALAINTMGLGTVIISSVETGTTTTAGALTFEVSDGTNWWAVEGQQIGSYTIQSTYSLANNTNVAWQFDIGGFQQFRVRLSQAITGTGSPQAVLIAQAMAAANDITPTVGWGQRLDQVNDAVTNYPFGHQYQNITTNTTTTLKSGAGVLSILTLNNTALLTVANLVITIFDNTAGSGTKIGTFTIPFGQAGAMPLQLITKELAFGTGLTIVTSGPTVTGDITVGWR